MKTRKSPLTMFSCYYALDKSENPLSMTDADDDWAIEEQLFAEWQGWA